MSLYIESKRYYLYYKMLYIMQLNGIYIIKYYKNNMNYNIL